MTIADILNQLQSGNITTDEALNKAYSLGFDENEIETLTTKLASLTNNFLFIEYYSHASDDCFKILNEYTGYAEEKIVLCKASEGIKKALKLACECIEKEKAKFYSLH